MRVLGLIAVVIMLSGCDFRNPLQYCDFEEHAPTCRDGTHISWCPTVINRNTIHVPPTPIWKECRGGGACVEHDEYAWCVAKPAKRCSKEGAARCRSGQREVCSTPHERKKTKYRKYQKPPKGPLYWTVPVNRQQRVCAP